MFTVVPWSFFLALMALELLAVLVLRVGVDLVAALPRRRPTHQLTD